MFKKLFDKEKLPATLEKWGSVAFWICCVASIIYLLYSIATITIVVIGMNEIIKDGNILHSYVSRGQLFNSMITYILTFLEWNIIGITIKLFSNALSVLLKKEEHIKDSSTGSE